MRRVLLAGREGEGGMALVLVVLVLSILTAMVVEFSYNIFVNTSLLTNWQRLQEISLAAESGVSVVVEGQKIRKKLLGSGPVKNDYFNVRVLTLPPMDPFGLGIKVGLTVVDENSKLNINKIEPKTGSRGTSYFDALTRLLEALELDPALAEAIREHMYGLNLLPTKLESVDELMLVAGIDREVYNTLSPYVTAYDTTGININTAEAEVLMALAVGVTEEMAETAIQGRPYEHGDFVNKSGIVPDAGLLSEIKETGDVLNVVSKATDQDGLTREIHCVMKSEGEVYYWREL